MPPTEYAQGRLLVEEAEPHIVRWTLNDPDRRNVLDLELLLAMREQLAEAERNDVRVLVITGNGRAFCAGFNIGKIRRMEFSEKESRPTESADARIDSVVVAFMDELRRFPGASIAMLNGHAFGVGGELAATCDFRISGGKGMYGMPPARLGLCYHHEGIRRFIDLCGPAAAKELFFTGEPITMSRAHEVGIVTHLVRPEDLEADTLTLARRIANAAPLSVKNMKKIFYLLSRYPELPVDVVRQMRSFEHECFTSEDLVEGRKAFLEKRKPEWRGH